MAKKIEYRTAELKKDEKKEVESFFQNVFFTNALQSKTEALTNTLAARSGSNSGSTSPTTSPAYLKRSSENVRTGRSKAQKLWKVTSPSELSDMLIAKSQRSGSRSRSPSPTTSPRTGKRKSPSRSPDVGRMPLPVPVSLLNHVNDGQPVTMPGLPINALRSPVMSPRNPAADANVYNLMETISKLDQTTRTLLKQSFERLAKKADQPSETSAPTSPNASYNDETKEQENSNKSPVDQELETSLEQKVMNMLLTVSSPMSSPRDRPMGPVGVAAEPINPFTLPANTVISTGPVTAAAPGSTKSSPRVVVPPIPLGFINNVNNVNSQNPAYHSPNPSPRSPKAEKGATTPKGPVSPHPSAAPMQQVQVTAGPNQAFIQPPPGTVLPEGTFMYAAPAPTSYVGNSSWWTVNVGGQQRLINSSLYPYMVNNRTVLLPNTAIDPNGTVPQNIQQQPGVFVQGQAYAPRPDSRSNMQTIQNYYQNPPAPTPKSPSKNRKRSTSGSSSRRTRKTDGSPSLTSSAECITSPRSLPTSPAPGAPLTSPRSSISTPSPSPQIPPLALSGALASPRPGPLSSPRMNSSSPRNSISPRSLSSPRTSSPRIAAAHSASMPQAQSIHAQPQMGTVTLVSYSPSPYYLNPMMPTATTPPPTMSYSTPPMMHQPEYGATAMEMSQAMSEVDSFYNAMDE
eukprot:TRINITY_DN1887_c0_g1_i7.p1 TRINITY_DN1887_c0_g1~~TRINITY_DN1887_c0_g1_i7.p1  ORF type:complete len:684 (-),score=116.37 TRINITY_DN1887_c0_g1_i7:326-2377(-)